MEMACKAPGWSPVLHGKPEGGAGMQTAPQPDFLLQYTLCSESPPQSLDFLHWRVS